MPRKTDAPRTRVYVSHDQHTVALLRPDALARLEKWLNDGPHRSVWRIDISIQGAYWVGVDDGKCGRFHGDGETLSAAIHAALDQAGAKR
mgnify:CR=1 FL=1